MRLLILFSVVVWTGGCTEELETNFETNPLVETTEEFAEDREGLKKSEVKKQFAADRFFKLDPVADSAFLSLERFEEPAIKKMANPVDQKKTFWEKEENSILAQERLLIFTGEGFDTKLFGENSDGKLTINYHYHINSPSEHSLLPKSKDFIDLESDDLKDSHDLIFHLPTTLFNKTEYLDDELSVHERSSIRKTLRVMEPIPQTQILMNGSPESVLVLRRDSSNIDLLAEEESLNWKRYYGR